MSTRTTPQPFTDPNFFPAFRACPGEHVWDDRYLEDAVPGDPNSAGRNRKHWCLLGEIVSAETLLRPGLVARDRDGVEFVVAFYPEDQGDMPRLLRDFRVGNTVAVMYALGHGFLDGTAGVRVEDSDEVLMSGVECE